MQSHPSWVRGLKPPPLLYLSKGRPSHPSWVRGLKRPDSYPREIILTSHPSWVRGLKPAQVDVWSQYDRRTPRGCVD